jgi:tetratricopeptide (TPR) repeat protein
VAQYSLGDAARILRVSPQRLRYWKRIDLMRPKQSGASEESSESRGDGFEFQDLVCARAILSLIDQGLTLRRIRSSVEHLRAQMPDLDDPLTALRVWAEGSPRVVVDRDGALVEPGGQLVLDFRSTAQAPSVAELARARDLALTREHTAIEWFERGCQLDSDPACHGEAEDAFRRAIALEPAFADAHCNLGAVLYNRGQRAAARRCFEHCLSLDRRHVEANFNLANMLEEDGADRLALRHYLEAWRSDPSYPDVHVHLALLYEKLGMPVEARVYWARYLEMDIGTQDGWKSVARERLAPSESEG